MKVEAKKIIPYRIKQARVSRAFSALELGEKIGVTRQAVSQYEIGKTEPSMAVLNLMSSVLKYPTSFFYKPLPSEESVDSAVFFRSGQTTRIKSYNAAKEKIKIFADLKQYLGKYIDYPATNLPKIDYIDDEELLTNEKFEEYALALRECWDLGLSPINNLIGATEKNGILASRMNLGLSKIDGFSLWHNNHPFIFLCTDKESNARVRFSIAHELGHILLHAGFFAEEELKDKDLHKRLEREANIFAGALLLPEKTFSKDIYSTSIDHFIQLKSKWKVSISAMINRSETLGLLSANQIKYLNDQMTSRNYWRSEPYDSSTAIEKPIAHKQAIDLLLNHKILSLYDFVEETGIHLNELEEYCFLEKGTLILQENPQIIALRQRSIHRVD